jgi:hypothetical protein
MKTRYIRAWLAVVLALLLVSCSGGGGGSSGGTGTPSGNWDTMLWDQGNWS